MLLTVELLSAEAGQSLSVCSAVLLVSVISGGHITQLVSETASTENLSHFHPE